MHSILYHVLLQRATPVSKIGRHTLKVLELRVHFDSNDDFQCYPEEEPGLGKIEHSPRQSCPFHCPLRPAGNAQRGFGRHVTIFIFTFFLFFSLFCFNKTPETLRCTSESADVDVPGLTLLERFVGEAEEMTLLSHFVEADAPWTGPLRRRVQHYGCVDHRLAWPENLLFDRLLVC